MSGVDLCAHGNRGDQPCTPCMLAGYIAEAERALWWWDQGAPVHPDHAKQLVMTLTDALKSAVAEYALQVGVRAPSAPPSGPGGSSRAEDAPPDVTDNLPAFDAAMAEWRKNGSSDAWLYLKLRTIFVGALGRREEPPHE